MSTFAFLHFCSFLSLFLLFFCTVTALPVIFSTFFACFHCFFGSFDALLGTITKFLVVSMPFSGKPLLPTGSPRLTNISRTYRFLRSERLFPAVCPFLLSLGTCFHAKSSEKGGFRFVKNKKLYKKTLFCKERRHKNRNNRAKFSSNRCGRDVFLPKPRMLNLHLKSKKRV